MANDIAEKEVSVDSKEIEIAVSNKIVDNISDRTKATLCMYAVANTLSACTYCDYLSDIAYNNIYQSMVDTCIKATK